jgi:hypothetical protein
MSVLTTKNSPVELQLQEYFEKLLIMVEKTSKTSGDSILLAGAMMGVARILYFDNLSNEEAESIIDYNTSDFIQVIKPTIH